MSASYGLRLICLCLACLFLANLAVSLLVRIGLPTALRWAERLRARKAADFLFALRILPATAAVCVVLALCVPSYLLFEPHAGAEHLTPFALLASVFGTALLLCAAIRTLGVLGGSKRLLRRAECCDSAAVTGGNALVIECDAPVLALAGVIRPRLLVSRRVLDVLSPEQLGAALRHERAHRCAFDNLKRLVVLLSPTALPFSSGIAALERSLARYTEWAADDDATGGDPQRSLDLADALLRVSALKGAQEPLPFLASSLVADDCALSARIDRLLNVGTPPEVVSHRLVLTLAVAAGIGSMIVLSVVPSSLGLVHTLLERLLA